MGGAGAPGENIFTEPIQHFTLCASMFVLIIVTILLEKLFHYASHAMNSDEMKRNVLNVRGERPRWCTHTTPLAYSVVVLPFLRCVGEPLHHPNTPRPCARPQRAAVRRIQDSATLRIVRPCTERVVVRVGK